MLTIATVIISIWMFVPYDDQLGVSSHWQRTSTGYSDLYECGLKVQEMKNDYDDHLPEMVCSEKVPENKPF